MFEVIYALRGLTDCVSNRKLSVEGGLDMGVRGLLREERGYLIIPRCLLMGSLALRQTCVCVCVLTYKS